MPITYFNIPPITQLYVAPKINDYFKSTYYSLQSTLFSQQQYLKAEPIKKIAKFINSNVSVLNQELL